MSLRRRLILAITLVLAFACSLSVVIISQSMNEELVELTDHELIQITHLAWQIDPEAVQSKGEPEATALSERRGERRKRRGEDDNEIVVERWDGQRRTTLLPGRVDLPRPTRPSTASITISGDVWRVLVSGSEEAWIVAGQRMEGGAELVVDALLGSAMPVIGSLPVVALLIVVVVKGALTPLQRLTLNIKQRPALDNAPLNAPDAPIELRPLIDAFNQLLIRVTAAVGKERSFVTDAAHALRTPVTALQLQAEALKEAKSKSDFVERLDDLVAGIARTRRLVEQLLQLARAEHSIAGSSLPAEIIQELHDELVGPLHEKGVRLRLDIDDGRSAVVPVHATTLSIVLRNLTDNAARYTARGGTITLGARVDKHSCRMWVRDEGCGPGEEDLERLFDRFYRPAQDSTSGTGLGLSIARESARAARGDVWLERAPHSTGLIAVVELPLAL